MAVERTPPRTQRSQVLDLSAPAAVEVEIDVAEAAEVLMSICVLGDREDYDTFDLGEEWLKARLESVPPELMAAVDGLMLGDLKLAAHMLGIVFETPKPRTFASFFERLQATDAFELKKHLFACYGSHDSHLSAPDVIERAVAGDADAKEELLASLVEYSAKYESARTLLEVDGADLKAQIVEILPRWYEEVFLPDAPAWREAAERDVEAKRDLAASRSPEELTELVTRGYQYVPPRGIRTLAFFPSWWMRPWVLVWEHKGTKIFSYPIAPQPEAGASPSEVARVYKALGDEGRLRLLRRLSDGPVTLTEAAGELDVAKSTAHHHLAILRQAGFVMVREGNEKVYSLRRDLLPQAGDLLNAYLESSRSSSTIA
jgi:DNA-binding transcriptional ArsR family regulator